MIPGIAGTHGDWLTRKQSGRIITGWPVKARGEAIKKPTAISWWAWKYLQLHVAMLFKAVHRLISLRHKRSRNWHLHLEAHASVQGAWKQKKGCQGVIGPVFPQPFLISNT